MPQRVIREGEKSEELLMLIDEDEDIALLILAAGIGSEGPGPLVTTLARSAGEFPIPVALVPGHLSDEDLDTMSGGGVPTPWGRQKAGPWAWRLGRHLARLCPPFGLSISRRTVGAAGWAKACPAVLHCDVGAAPLPPYSFALNFPRRRATYYNGITRQFRAAA